MGRPEDYSEAYQRLIEKYIDKEKISKKKSKQAKINEFQRQVKKLDKIGLIQELKTKYGHFNYALKQATGLDKGISTKDWGSVKRSEKLLNRDQAAHFTYTSGERSVFKRTKARVVAFEKWKGGGVREVVRNKQGRFARRKKK